MTEKRKEKEGTWPKPVKKLKETWKNKAKKKTDTPRWAGATAREVGMGVIRFFKTWCGNGRPKPLGNRISGLAICMFLSFIFL